ncbi:hypothetical protein T02_2412 [Trichinella nativa]|uniref:Uncharacterized protein n=1 Tax=Trichinella nativa TaxID=6335 RepID=A0A0V1LNU7_9BILA|nr:hypothetical protein T02_2412 [Trichinella nativa]
MLLAVAFLPVPQIDTGFSVLEAGTTANLSVLFQYFWQQSITVERLQLQNVHNVNIRTCNHLESWHNRLYKKTGKSHASTNAISIFTFCFLIIHVIIFYTKLLDMPKHSLAKVEEATLHLGVEKVALNSRDQGCFEIAKKRRGIKLEASFFT